MSAINLVFNQTREGSMSEACQNCFVIHSILCNKMILKNLSNSKNPQTPGLSKIKNGLNVKTANY